MSASLDRLAASSPPEVLRFPSALPEDVQRVTIRVALVFGDILMLALAFFLAYWIRFDLHVSLSPEVVASPGFYTMLVLVLTPVWLGLFALHGLYDWESLFGGTLEYARAFNACTAGAMLVMVATFAEPSFFVARGWLISAWTLSVLLVCAARFLVRRVVYAARRRGHFLVPAVIIGRNGEALTLVDQLIRHQSAGYRILGVVTPRGVDSGDTPSLAGTALPLLGSTDEIGRIVAQFGVRELIVAVSSIKQTELWDLFERIQPLPGVVMRLSTGLYEILTTGVQVRTAASIPFISLNKLRLDPVESALKTAMEFVLSVAGLLVLSPLLGLIALLVKLDSPGPSIHRRRVLGVGGREFDAFKFRTMYVNGDRELQRNPELGAMLAVDCKLKHDPRVTRVGRWLRRYSLDELPQLLNVLLGQMSLVGPRMITAEEAAKYGRHKVNLLTVKPGITGLWQVSGRSDLSYDERVRLDMHYIRNYSIWLDLQILFVQTPGAVIRATGAY